MLNPLAAPGDFMGSDTSLRSRPQPQRQCLQGQPGPPEPRLKHRCWLLGGCARVSRDGAGWGSRERSGEQGANPQRSWAWGSCDVCSRFSQFAQSSAFCYQKPHWGTSQGFSASSVLLPPAKRAPVPGSAPPEPLLCAWGQPRPCGFLGKLPPPPLRGAQEGPSMAGGSKK